MKCFLAFKVISTWIFVYFQKGFTMKLWQNTHQRGEYNVMVQDSEPIRLIELPRSLSVYILNTCIAIFI